MTDRTSDSPPKLVPPVEGEVILALDCKILLDEVGVLPNFAVVHRRYGDLAALLRELTPSRIILPLFAAGYDATAAIEELEALKFPGQIIVIAPDLPRPRLVERELRALGPGLRLTLITP